MFKRPLRIATRKSPLALWQAEHIGQKLQERWPELQFELVPMLTSGDRFLKDKLLEEGGKGLFVKELEEAILDGKADCAVHSLKDVPAFFPPGLQLACIFKRDNAQDALVSNQYPQLSILPLNSIVGTSSLRRGSQLLALRPDLQIKLLRGNIHTRLRKLDEGQYDAIILAVAGLQRMELGARIGEIMSLQIMLPACGQGALGVECRSDDEWTKDLLKPLHDEQTNLCVSTERKVNALLGGNCHVPLAVYCQQKQQQLHLHARVLAADGSQVIEHEVMGSIEKSIDIAQQCVEALLQQGAQTLLAQPT